MKKILNKIKVMLATLWTAIISFPLKVMGEEFKILEEFNGTPPNISFEEVPMQGLYGTPHVQSIYGVPLSESESIAIKIVQVLLVAVIFIVGVISFIKIRKIDDKTLKKKKIKNTIIIITILVLILVAAFIIPARLLAN